MENHDTALKLFAQRVAAGEFSEFKGQDYHIKRVEALYAKSSAEAAEAMEARTPTPTSPRTPSRTCMI